ncbi:cytochrome b N-terminal domain-containing protein [Limibaculum sp. FT325]|uniref:cytochrome b N-terminal domain-containing protein n=1 Tax=Thermohalobaculum sediminis TaxID=2939436 RepID=UPI0020BF85F0|nr:cytochrome b N-terminal domain-containing protein [Limibaculum sediminis]MCL5778951.1 cytochrome b N-terminal domain-containing protein [Limibaculum sediminis]
MTAGPRAVLRHGFDRLERILDRAFGPDWNPLAQLGPLGWFLFWIVAVTGIYLFIFFDTGVTDAYASVTWLSADHWWHAGVARSLHRYASDLMVVVMFTHLIREWAMDRYRGRRWFSWITGVPVIWFVYLSGITGYWLVWDDLAQYVALTSTELLDSLGIFAEPIARNFLAPELLSSRFFTLMVFLHIAIPLLLLLLMWIHIQRITSARTRPPRVLGAITLGALVVGSVAMPAPLGRAADLATVPTRVDLDWFLLSLYPVIESLPAGAIWAGVAGFTVLLAGLPWLPPRREGAAAAVFLDHCNGCARCVADCPYAAITLVPRSDGLPFAHEVEVNAARCVACGICMGACPSSTPFRRSGELITGIDLPDRPLAALRADAIAASGALAGAGRVLTLACAHGAAGAAPGRIILPCVAMAPPSLVDFIISRGLADGVAVAGCAERDCFNRLGVAWTRARFARERDPYLRARVPRERVLTVWAGPSERPRLEAELSAFAGRLATLPAYENLRPLGDDEAAATPTREGGAR